MTVYKAKVSKEFIEHRDSIINKRDAGIRGADSEFVEFHQAKIDPMQKLYEHATYDTYHMVLGRIDYKQYSEAGVHVSEWIQKQIALGKIDVLGIWKWYPKNQWEKLKEGMTVQYEILDFVNAKTALEFLDKETNRFKYPFY